ncbi:hypothetical protein HDV62DRAFT_205316 [Trichoderma sp. SZMC 28011]
MVRDTRCSLALLSGLRGPLDLVTSCRGVARTRINPALAPITPHPPPPCATIMAIIFFHLSLSPPCAHFEPTALGLYQERWSVNDNLPHYLVLTYLHATQVTLHSRQTC